MTVLQEGKQLRVEGGFWQKNTDYKCTVTIAHKLLPQIFTFDNSTSFKTEEPPYGGTVSTFPGKGYLGDDIILYVFGWETPNDPVHYLVFETTNEEGTERGNLLTQKPQLQNVTYTYKLPRYPILVVIVDNLGEAATKVVKIDIRGVGRKLEADFELETEFETETEFEQNIGDEIEDVLDQISTTFDDLFDDAMDFLEDIEKED